VTIHTWEHGGQSGAFFSPQARYWVFIWYIGKQTSYSLFSLRFFLTSVYVHIVCSLCCCPWWQTAFYHVFSVFYSGTPVFIHDQMHIKPIPLQK